MNTFCEYIGPQYSHLSSRRAQIIGVEVNEGQDHDGPQLAPKYLRDANLVSVLKELKWTVDDLGNITKDDFTLEEINADKTYKYDRLQNSREIGAVCKTLHEKTKQIAKEKSFCLTLGGDHGIASGSISGLKAVHPDLKIIWVDAHGDCNTPETSPSGNYHGMPVAHLLGWIPKDSVLGFDWFNPCLKTEDIVYIGLRDLDLPEKILLRKHGIKCFTMDDVERYGIAGVMEKTLQYLDPCNKDLPLHISFDIDAVDPNYAYGTGTKARGGLNYREAHYLMRTVAATGNLVGLDLVEINPLMEKEAQKDREVLHGDNKLIKGSETVTLGVELIASAMGYTLI